MAYPLVWTEREAGDWEACVIAAGLMALMYGGVYKFPLGAYTQAEREALEPVWDEPTNFSGMNAAFQKRYGIQIRALSTGSIADAVTRKGIGLLLAGKFGIGSIANPTVPGTLGAFTHASFFVPLGDGRCLYYEPMDANMSEPRVVSNSQVINWAKGADANSAREVRQWEFGTLPAGVKMVIRPVSEQFSTKTGNSTPGGQFYLEGPGAGSPKWFTQSVSVTSVAQSVDGTYCLVFYWNGGPAGGEYLWMPRVNLNPVAGSRDPAAGYATNPPDYSPAAPVPAPPLDCADEVAAATLALRAELEDAKAQLAAAKASELTLRSLIRAHNNVEDSMQAID